MGSYLRFSHSVLHSLSHLAKTEVSSWLSLLHPHIPSLPVVFLSVFPVKWFLIIYSPHALYLHPSSGFHTWGFSWMIFIFHGMCGIAAACLPFSLSTNIFLYVIIQPYCNPCWSQNRTHDVLKSCLCVCCLSHSPPTTFLSILHGSTPLLSLPSSFPQLLLEVTDFLWSPEFCTYLMVLICHQFAFHDTSMCRD